MKIAAVVLFLSGLLLAVRVMFFGVQRRADDGHFLHRKWPLALAVLLFLMGAMFYARASSGAGVTGASIVAVVLVGVGGGAGAWWFVQRSSLAPSTDPDDDPRYRFQGHVARVIEPIRSGPGSANPPTGRIAFDFDGERFEFRARWLTGEEGEVGEAGGTANGYPSVPADGEVVIERVEGEVAYVEPWTVVEERL